MSNRQSAENFGPVSGRISSSDALQILRNFETELTRYEKQINDINVYPVPDCDTGTNVLATVRAGLVELGITPTQHGDSKSGHSEIGLHSIFGDFAQSAGLAARGNSGTILSEYFRGIAISFGNPSDISGADSANFEAEISHWHRALGYAATYANEAVLNPVAGTVITVADSIAQVQPCAELFAYLGDVSHAAKSALARTTTQLTQLEQAGVVDAGAFALVLFHETVSSFYSQQEVDLSSFIGPDKAGKKFQQQYLGPKFELTFQLVAQSEGFLAESEFRATIKQSLAPLGDSLTIVGSAPHFKIHIHTDEIEPVLRSAGLFGEVAQISTSELSEYVG